MEGVGAISGNHGEGTALIPPAHLIFVLKRMKEAVANTGSSADDRKTYLDHISGTLLK